MFCERRLRMRYVAMLALLAFLVVPLAGCKKAEEPAPATEEKATDLLNKAAEEAGKAAEEAGKAAPEAAKAVEEKATE